MGGLVGRGVVGRGVLHCWLLFLVPSAAATPPCSPPMATSTAATHSNIPAPSASAAEAPIHDAGPKPPLESSLPAGIAPQEHQQVAQVVHPVAQEVDVVSGSKIDGAQDPPESGALAFCTPAPLEYPLSSEAGKGMSGRRM